MLFSFAHTVSGMGLKLVLFTEIVRNRTVMNNKDFDLSQQTTSSSLPSIELLWYWTQNLTIVHN